MWKVNGLTIEGTGAITTVITGTPCAGKALLVTQGDAIIVSGLTLTGAHVAAFNGAGVRAEGGDLAIEHVRFVNDEDGLFAGPLPGKRITIRASDFINTVPAPATAAAPMVSTWVSLECSTCQGRAEALHGPGMMERMRI